MKLSPHLACNNGYLRDSCLGKRVEQLRAVLYYSSVLLLRAGEEAWHILQDYEGDVEGVAEPHKSSS